MSKKLLQKLKIRSQKSFLKKENENNLENFEKNEKIISQKNQSLLNLRDFEEINEKRKIFEKIKKNMSQLELCIYSLQIPNDKRDENDLIYIKDYLLGLYRLIDIINCEKNIKKRTKLLEELASSLKYEKINTNKFIYRYGQESEKVYIILKGKIDIIVPRNIKCYLTEEEYLEFLVKLKMNKEDELLKNIIAKNSLIYEIGNNFDYFLENIYNIYKSKSPVELESLPYSISFYKKLEELMTDIKNIEDFKNLNVYAEEYCEKNKIENENLPSQSRKLVSIFQYKYIGQYEKGQIFGDLGAENKALKELSSVIVSEDSELAYISKDKYLELLATQMEKYKSELYKLIRGFSIFDQMPKNLFDLKFFKNFKLIKLEKNSEIFNEYIPINKYYFLKSGELELNVNKNLNEINELILKLNKVRRELLNLPIDENIYTVDNINNNNDFHFMSKEKIKILTQKNNMILSIIKDHFLIGFQDTILMKNNMPLFNCKCISKECEAFEISKDYFDLLISDYDLKLKNKKICITKIEYYLKRLIEFRKDLLDKANNIDNKNYIDSENNNSNSRKNLFLFNNNIKLTINKSYSDLIKKRQFETISERKETQINYKSPLIENINKPVIKDQQLKFSFNALRKIKQRESSEEINTSPINFNFKSNEKLKIIKNMKNNQLNYNDIGSFFTNSNGAVFEEYYKHKLEKGNKIIKSLLSNSNSSNKIEIYNEKNNVIKEDFNIMDVYKNFSVQKNNKKKTLNRIKRNLELLQYNFHKKYENYDKNNLKNNLLVVNLKHSETESNIKLKKIKNENNKENKIIEINTNNNDEKNKKKLIGCDLFLPTLFSSRPAYDTKKIHLIDVPGFINNEIQKVYKIDSDKK